MATRVKDVKKRIQKKDLIKLFTSVPHDFVDDFYHILAEDKGETIFPISIEVVAKWLKIRKSALTQTLRESYEKGTDYVVHTHRITGRQNGGQNKKDYMLTVHCFKRLCMRSKTKKAEDVRTYFIEIDDFLTQYKDRILDGLLRKLNKKVSKQKTPDGQGWIYIFRAKKSIFKIGRAEDLRERLRGYNTGRADDIQLLATFETKNRMKAENCVKAFVQAKRYKKRRELYEVDQDIITRVMKMCAHVGNEKLHHNEEWHVNEDDNYYVFFADQA